METKTSLKGLSQLLTNIRPYLAMISLQFGYAGMYIVTMVSLKQGMSHWVLVVYRHVVAILAIAPFAFVLERKIRPKLTLSVFLKVMLLGLLEPVIDQNLYYMGMKSTSATFAAATVNVLPALTFIMAIILRMERVSLRQKHGLAKVIGTSITLSGAMLMTLYKGPAVNILGGYSHESEHENSGDTSSGQHWVAGTIMLLSCIVGWSAFFIVQSMTLKEYPAALSLTSLICVMGMLEGGVVALVMERDMSAWAIGFDSKLLAAAYSVACALIMAGEDIEKHTNVKDILIEMGTYFQVQDDYLDCFGAPKVIGKIGTDIEDFKCSWLVVKALELSNEEQKKFLYVIQHGACLGLGLAALGTADEDVFDDIKNVLYTDSAVAASGISMGLLMVGTASEKAAEILAYAHETQHEKIIRGLALGIALTVYGREEEADTLIEQMTRDQDPIIRYGGMYALALAYSGTANNKAIRELLHFAVSDVLDDVRRTAVLALGFVLYSEPEQGSSVSFM